MNGSVIRLICSWIMVLMLSFTFMDMHGYAESNDDQIVEFDNSGLREGIKLELGIDKNQDVTKADMKKLISLNLQDVRITTLKGLEHASNLNMLSMMHSNLEDISAIENLTSLERLYLDSNQIQNISSLSELELLEELYISGNRIKDISSLSKLKNLKELNIEDNEIVDTSPLMNLSELKSLSIGSNKINDITPLSNLTSITSLGIQNNSIKSINALKNMKKLETVDLSRIEASDISTLKTLTNLKRVQAYEVRDYDTMEWLNNQSIEFYHNWEIGFTEDNLKDAVKAELGIFDWNQNVSIFDIKKLEYLDVRNYGLTTLRGLEEATNLKTLSLDNNEIRDLSILEQLDSLEWVSLYGNKAGNKEVIQSLIDRGVTVHYNEDEITTVVFEDEELEVKVKRELGIYDDIKLTVSDMHELNQLDISQFDDYSHKYNSLVGLEHAKNLTYLDAKRNDITDIKMLEKLKSLEYLNLVDNQITDMKTIKKLLDRGIEIEYTLDETKQEEIPYNTIEEEDRTLYIDEKVVSQKGVKGEKEVSYRVYYHNGKETERSILEEHISKEPVDKIIKIGTKLPKLSLGDKHDDVSRLKENLERIGFEVLDGEWNLFDKATEEKVKEFQEYYGLKVDGIVDKTVDAKISEVLNSPLKIGAKGDHVVQLKLDLEKLGFFTGAHSKDRFDAVTLDQVKKFQKKYKLAENGIVDEVTLAKINELLNMELSLGVRHYQVTELKRSLAKLGFKVPGRGTELYGEETEAKVKEFQKYYGLKVTGIANEKTLAKIEKNVNTPLQNNNRHKDVVQLKNDLATVGFKVRGNNTNYYGGSTYAKVKAFQKKYNLVQTGIADEVTLAKLKSVVNVTLSNGVRHQEVVQLKKDLAKAGFKVPGKNTTLFGKQTEAKVKAFQKYYGLPVNGTANNATKAKLKKVVDSPLQNGKRHKDTIQLKKDLAKVGFKVPGNNTNLYGKQTVTKVKAFQKKYKLVQNGIADEVTLEKLKSVVNVTLSNGVRHQDVVQLKKDLAKAGFKVPGNNTTLFGKQTEAKVKAFQKYYGLAINGRVDNATKAKLKDVVESPLQNGKRHKETIQLKKDLAKAGFKVPGNNTNFYGKQTVTKVKAFQKKYKLVQNGIADEVTLAKLKSVVNVTLSNGVRHQDVVQLKKDLAKAGFKVPGNNTTLFGKQTEAKVKAFQKYYGLTTNGTVDKATKAKLKDVAESPLQNGKRHKDTIQLKKDLAKAGFKVPGNTTNFYGKQTVTKVKAFQKKYKLVQNGIADKVTLAKLKQVIDSK